MRRLPRSGSKGGCPRGPGATGRIDGSFCSEIFWWGGGEYGGGKRKEEGKELPGGGRLDLTRLPGHPAFPPLMLSAPSRHHDWSPGRQPGKVFFLSFLSPLRSRRGSRATSSECIGRGRFVRTVTPYKPMRCLEPESSRPRANPRLAPSPCLLVACIRTAPSPHGTSPHGPSSTRAFRNGSIISAKALGQLIGGGQPESSS